MKQLSQYIEEVLGLTLNLEPVAAHLMSGLPMYLVESYNLTSGVLFDKEILFAELRSAEPLNITATEKHVLLLRNASKKTIVLVLPELSSYVRKYLIKRGINFIVPDKQLFLPELLIDLKEEFKHPNHVKKTSKLLPSAQMVVLYHILDKSNRNIIENNSLKDLAHLLEYSAMALTKASENLKQLEIIDVVGEREKFFRFKMTRSELWRDLQNRKVFINPVLKQVYLDMKPDQVFMLQSNVSALPEYSDMNPSRQKFFAVDKIQYYKMEKGRQLNEIYHSDARVCLEVWKYNPLKLVENLNNVSSAVDPLSLYLSLLGSKDERIEMALEQVENSIVW
jgi:hypothetical protein